MKSTNFAPSDIPELTPASQLINSADLETPEQAETSESKIKSVQLTFMTDPDTMTALKAVAEARNFSGDFVGRKATVNSLLNEFVADFISKNEQEVSEAISAYEGRHKEEIENQIEASKTPLQKMREFRHISIEQLADLTEISAETLRKKENHEKVRLRKEQYDKLAAVFEIPANMLK